MGKNKVREKVYKGVGWREGGIRGGRDERQREESVKR